MRQYRLAIDAAITAANRAGDENQSAIMGRAVEKAHRLALIYACSADRHNLEITEDAAVWATKFIDHCTRQMLFAARFYISESEFDRKANRLLATLRTWQKSNPTVPMTKTAISRKMKLPVKEMTDVIESLLLRGEIEHVVTPTTGRPAEGYRLRDLMHPSYTLFTPA
jgi:hypothetical protein